MYYILILLILLQVLCISHVVILPLSKKRPIVINGIEGSLFIFTAFATIAAIIHPFVYIVALVFALFVYYTHGWIVYGVSTENIHNALVKAILAGRSTYVKTDNGLEIDNSMLVRVSGLGMNISYIRYKNKKYSKKSELIKQIVKKFLQNYYI